YHELSLLCLFLFNGTPPTVIYTLSLHDALPICSAFGANKKSIAVLPLQNLNADPSVDYLRFALADEIANVLTNSRALDVRPSAITSKYNGADLDPQQIGRALHVGNILTGHFVREE